MLTFRDLIHSLGKTRLVDLLTRPLAIALGALSFIASDDCFAATKRQAPPKSLFSVNANVIYANSALSPEQGGVDGLSLGLDFGVALTPLSNFFILTSYQDGPLGFQDVKLGLSSIFLLNTAYTDAISFNISVPTSKFSKSVQLITQITAANSLIIRFAPSFGIVSTIFGGKSFYSRKPNVLLSTDLYPSTISGPINSTVGRTPTSTGGTDPIDAEAGIEETGTGFTGNLNKNLVDEFYGTIFGFNFLLLPKLTLDSSVSVTKLLFSLSPAVFATDITPIQLTLTLKGFSTFASYSRFITAPIVREPKTENYTVGATLSFK